MAFTWKGVALDWEGVIKTALSLEGDEQKQFVKEFCASGPFARQNIGYISGYFDRETAKKILKVFETAHPIFGTSEPTPEEAFELGRKLGEQAKKT